MLNGDTQWALRWCSACFHKGVQLLLVVNGKRLLWPGLRVSTEGLMEVNMTEILMEEIELKFSKFFDVQFGGHWKPKDCKPRWKVGTLYKISDLNIQLLQTLIHLD